MEKSKNHATFVANAVEDMSKKREQKNQELQQELQGSAFLIRKAQQAQSTCTCTQQQKNFTAM